MINDLKKGTRIYYGGDMANQHGFGTVTDKKTDKWGTVICIKLDDGREVNVMSTSFSNKYDGTGSTKFVTEAAYKEFIKKRFEKHNNREE